MRPPPRFVLEQWHDTRQLGVWRPTAASAGLLRALRYGVGVPLIVLALGVLIAGDTDAAVGGAAMLAGCGVVALLLSTVRRARVAGGVSRSRREDRLRFLQDRKP
jgi:hypothetical protein